MTALCAMECPLTTIKMCDRSKSSSDRIVASLEHLILISSYTCMLTIQLTSRSH